MASLRRLKVRFDSFDDLVDSIGPGLSRTHLFVPLAALAADDAETAPAPGCGSRSGRHAKAP